MIGYNVFLKLGEKVKFNQQPIEYFPKNPALFLSVKNLSKTIDHFTATSMIWSLVEDDSSQNSLSDLYDSFRAIINDSVTNKLFGNGKTYIGIYNNKDTVNWLIIKNVIADFLEIKSKDTVIINSRNNSFYLSQRAPFLAISNSKKLLANFNDNFILEKNPENEIKNKMAFASELSQISGLVNVSEFTLMNNLLLSTYFVDEYQSLLNTNEWFQFDINYNPKEISIIGITNNDDSLELSSPNYFSFSELIPNELEYLNKRMVNIQFDNNKLDTCSLQSIKFKFRDDIQNENHEIIVVENPTDSGLYSLFLSEIFNDSLSNNTSNDEYRILNKNFINQYFYPFNTSKKYGFIGSYYTIIASEKAKKELDYELAHKTQINIDEAILSVNENKEYDQAQSLFFHYSKNELIKKLRNYNLQINPSILSFFNAVGGLSWTVNNFSNRAHHAILIKKDETKKIDKNILWKLKLPPISWGPYTLKNHRTGTKDIAVLDTSNKFYLIGANGKVKWSKNLYNPIVGGISQIDAYKNGKYQMVFNTENEIHILDILGHELERFPIKLANKAINPVAILDYDKNSDFRFVIATENQILNNFTIEGKKVKGWSNPKLNSDISSPVTHFAINGKDYIFALTNNGNINLFNRKGEVRHKVNHTINRTNGKYYIKKDFNIDSSSLVYEDQLGNLFEYKFGDYPKKLFVDSMNNDSLALNINNTNSELSYYALNKKQFKIIDNGGQSYQFSFPYNFIIQRPSTNYTAVINTSIDEIQLIDGKYRLHPTLFRGSKLFDVDNINNDKFQELITVVNQTVLVCYQVPVLK
ncbi:MAG: hypothetical protein ACJ0QO_01190 [Parvicellaceae bacterium]